MALVPPVRVIVLLSPLVLVVFRCLKLEVQFMRATLSLLVPTSLSRALIRRVPMVSEFVFRQWGALVKLLTMVSPLPGPSGRTLFLPSSRMTSLVVVWWVSPRRVVVLKAWGVPLIVVRAESISLSTLLRWVLMLVLETSLFRMVPTSLWTELLLG